MAYYCQRCDRAYNTPHAIDQHLRDSPNHYECPKCNFDGPTWDALLQHCRDHACRIVCQGCNHGHGRHWDADRDEYWQHLSDLNVCRECEKHFDSPSNLWNHQLSHRIRTYECYICPETFKTYSGMIIHLEYGFCYNQDAPSPAFYAARGPDWGYYIDRHYHKKLSDNGDVITDVKPFIFPDCDAAFSKLSGLFQHVESPACKQTMDDPIIGRLCNYLKQEITTQTMQWLAKV